MFRRLLISLALTSATVAAGAQAVPAATRPLTAQLGAGFAVARSGYVYNYIKGVTAYATVDYHQWLGLESDYHSTNIWTPDDIGERTLLLGPRLTFIHGEFNGRPNFVNVYAKFQGGLGWFEYQSPAYQPSFTNRYRMLAYGGGIEIRAARHLNIRPVELEWQRWPSATERGLKPVVATFGAAYAF